MATDGRRLRELLDADPDHAWPEFLDEHSALIFGVVRFYERDPDRASDCFLFVCEELCRNRFRRLRRFDPSGPASFATWLRAVVRNLCVDWKRKKFGRFRVFRSIESLSPWEQELFRCVYQRGMGSEEALLVLKPRFPELSRMDVRSGITRVEESLSSHQHWLLSLLVRREMEADEIADGRPDPESETLERERTELVAREVEKLPAEDRLLVKLRFEKDLSLSQVADVMGIETPQGVDRRLRKILSGLKRALARGKTGASSV
jgi:RNA polymerase sigma factor (sigma-70 family)